jgi:hypothetical protein
MGDGRLNKCKECCKEQARKNRLDKVEYYREYDMQRLADRPKRIRSKPRPNAHNILNRAVKKGIITRPENCERCGCGGKIEGHHDDYDKPLDVMWLCPACHAGRHLELGRLGKSVRPITNEPYKHGGRRLADVPNADL